MASYAISGVEIEKLKGSKTEQNLHTALSGESQAYLRYKWFEKKAKECVAGASGSEEVKVSSRSEVCIF